MHSFIKLCGIIRHRVRLSQMEQTAKESGKFIAPELLTDNGTEVGPCHVTEIKLVVLQPDHSCTSKVHRRACPPMCPVPGGQPEIGLAVALPTVWAIPPKRRKIHARMRNR